MRTLFALTLLAPSVALAECPTAPDHSAALAGLFDQARAATSPAAGAEPANRMWELWTDAPDGQAQDLLDAGMERIRMSDWDGANKALNALIDYCPDYAEGYNQRAFVSFLTDDFEAALPDLDRTLSLSPTHVGALAGKALTLLALGRQAEGQKALKQALALNPWLSERTLLSEPPGQDI
ncbi:tetratricopeptide repeat protein [Donghicola tyrosinivorans]|uniref:Uncharacterized protein n=1 Tax=Donghicola tyrosinivorans TaxID=1652492 RepID=A0A2T0WWQ2_9RHOB|nr:hypothetical protein [Donghicola tyrosinivorans]PRY91111.1 hypothetical protein CLV74_104124 [Donghicola tyrosinivorans]